MNDKWPPPPRTSVRHATSRDTHRHASCTRTHRHTYAYDTLLTPHSAMATAICSQPQQQQQHHSLQQLDHVGLLVQLRHLQCRLVIRVLGALVSAAAVRLGTQGHSDV